MSYLAALASKGQNILYIYVHDSEGRTLVDTTDKASQLGKITVQPFGRKAIASGRPLIQSGPDIIETAAPVLLGGNRLGTVRIGFSPARIAEDTMAIRAETEVHINRALKQIRINVVLTAAFVLLLSIVCGIIISRQLALPVKALASVSRKVSEGDLSQRLEEMPRNELGDVAASFNRMTENLQRTTVSRNYVEGIVSSLMSAVIVTDPVGRVQMTNRAARDLLGFREREMLNRPIEDILGDEVPLADFGDGTANGNPSANHIETTLHGRGGKRIPVFFSASVIRDGQGSLQGIVCSALDITLRKKAEGAIAQYTQQLEHSNQIKELFTDILSHDLLNPASIIAHMSALMGRQNPELDSEGLNMINRNARKLMEMIKDASTYARIESSDSLPREENDLVALISAVIERLHPAAAEKNMTVVFEPKGEAPAFVSPLVEDVFENLISNALKYAPGDTRIIVDIDSLGEDLLVSVADQGDGIPDQFKEAVFERFQRGKNAGVKGSGLGLAIARRIVRFHGGQIWVEDAPEGGSVFFVRMPKGFPPV
jgi:PAS domain S-box-containing protein